MSITAPTAPKKILILGGGPTGLYAARRLAVTGHAVTLLEKADRPGGLATSHPREGNWYDMGVHMLHEYDQEIFHDIRDNIMGPERLPVQLDAKIRWAGSFYRYPLQFGDMIKGIPLLKLTHCVFGLFGAQLWYKLFPREPKDAEQALIQLYGRPLYEFFFRDFTHRYWGFPTTELDAKFITSKMPRLSAVDVIKKVLSKVGIKDKVHAVDSALLDETLHYSPTGAEHMTRRIAEWTAQQGADIRLNQDVEQIHVKDGKVTGVTSRDSRTGETVFHECDYCINTIPLPHLISRMDNGVPQEVKDACEHLKFKPITIHGLLVNKPKCIEGLYIYYRERLFHRVGEPKNAGLVVNPPDHSVLIVETTCEKGDDKWNATEEVREQIKADLEAENIVNRDQIVQWHVLNAEHGYPVFRLGFNPYFDLVMAHIATLSNLRTAGRQGAFCYPNMHGAMRQGANTAKDVLEQIARETV